MIVVAAR